LIFAQKSFCCSAGAAMLKHWAQVCSNTKCQTYSQSISSRIKLGAWLCGHGRWQPGAKKLLQQMEHEVMVTTSFGTSNGNT